MAEPLSFRDDREMEEELRRLLLEASAPEALGLAEEELEEVPVEVDRAVRSRLRSGRRGPARHPRRGCRRNLVQAACAGLVLVVGLGWLVTVNPAARAWAEKVVSVLFFWHDEYADFTFTGEQPWGNADDVWKPAYLPEGYEEVESRDLEGAVRHSIFYENASGGTLDFDYVSVEQGCQFNLDNEHSDYRRLTLNGQPAHLFDTNTEGRPSFLVWFNESGSIAYRLIGEMPGEELVKVAESVVKVPWELGYVPAGYVQTGEEDRTGYHADTYENGAGAQIKFWYSRAEREYRPPWGPEDEGYQESQIRGRTCYLLENTAAGGESHLVWLNEGESIVYHLTAALPREELMKMANHLVIPDPAAQGDGSPLQAP